MRVDRRTTLKWLAASLAAANAACTPDRESGPWLGTATPPGGEGYGTDPDLGNPAVPWPLTMTGPQLRTAAVLCDMILPADGRSPAASEVGVPGFIDEWVSAPYPRQREDRELILDGLEWLEAECRARSDRGFAIADVATRTELLELLADARAGALVPARMLDFFRRFRYVAVGAFYSTDAGMKDAGYVGNVAISGPYPGPSEEAMEHLRGVLEDLGLTLGS